MIENAGEFAENFVRKDFLPSEAVAIEEAVRPLEKKLAKERQREHGGTAPGRKLNTGAKLAQVSRGKTRDKVARYVGMGRTNLKTAKEVVEAAKKEPEKFGSLVEEGAKRQRAAGQHGKEGGRSICRVESG
jgi:hypothetical protein